MQPKRLSMISWGAILVLQLGVFSGRCVAVDPQPGEPFQFVGSVQSPNAKPFDSFGLNLGHHGDDVLIGSVFESVTYLFDPGTWEFVQEFHHPRGAVISSSLAASDDRVFVCLPGTVYAFDVATGQQIATASAPRTATNFGWFGRSSVVYGDWLFVGAPELRDGLPYLRFGYVAKYEEASLSLSRMIENPTPNDPTSWYEDGAFGYSLALTQQHIVVGDRRDKVNGRLVGGVYLLDPGDGHVVRTLTSPDPDTSYARQFGISVAALGNLVLVGDNMAAVDGISQTGSAYLFDGLSGELLRSLPNPDPQALDNFGVEVALLQNYAIVGSFDGPNREGAAYVFDVATGELVQTIRPSDVAGRDVFGSIMTTVGDSMIAFGTPGLASAGQHPGTVYLYRLVPEPFTAAWLALAGLVLLGSRRPLAGQDRNKRS